MSRLRIQLEGSMPWDPALLYEAMEELFPKEDLSDFEEKNKELISKMSDTHQSILRPSDTLKKAMWIGEMLLKQKQELSHGEFVNFVKRNFSFSERTSRNYMSLYKNKDKIKEAQVKSMRDAYQLTLGTAK
jgi:hypothetical protein